VTNYAFCPALGLASSTAALTHGCRCEVCSPWYEQHLEQRREGRPAKVIHHESPRCPENGCAASTAYRKLKCRCDTCRGWNSARERRRKVYAKTEAIWVRFEKDLQEDPGMLIDFLTWVAHESNKIAKRKGST